MGITFKELCERYQFDNDDKFDALKVWCHNNVATDAHFTGSLAEQHAEYLSLAKDYLDNFMVQQPASLGHTSPSFNGMTTLQYAAKQGYDHYIANVSRIAPEIINQTTVSGMTPLHLAAANGHLRFVKKLLKRGANATLINKNNDEPPIFSALVVPVLHDEHLLARKEYIFNLLINAAPKCLARQNKSGDTVLHLMAANGFTRLLANVIKQQPQALCISNNRTLYPIHTAVLNRQYEIIDLLLKNPLVVAQVDSQQRNALHFAAQYGGQDILQRCCDVFTNIDILDGEHNTPLMLATQANNTESINTLLKHGADIEATDRHGNTILHLAVDKMDEDLIHWIMNNTEININLPNDEGKTPLAHLIEEHCGEVYFAEIEHLLLEKGARTSGSAFGQLK